MRILIILCLVPALFLFSCQKEVDLSNGSNGVNITGSDNELLQKIVSKSGSDSSSLIFEYNSSDELVILRTIDVSGGATAVSEERAVRNSQGIIERLIIKDDQYRQFGVDSVVTIVQYSAGKYMFKVTTIDVGIGVFKDSVAIVYDPVGNVISERMYDDLALGSYDETAKIDFTYDDSNIATIKQYVFDARTSSYSLRETFSYEQYDNQRSPLTIGYDAFVFNSPSLYSSNNPTRNSIASQGAPVLTYATTYTYNPLSKPSTAVAIIQPGNSTVTSTYYYQ